MLPYRPDRFGHAVVMLARGTCVPDHVVQGLDAPSVCEREGEGGGQSNCLRHAGADRKDAADGRRALVWQRVLGRRTCHAAAHAQAAAGGQRWCQRRWTAACRV